MKTSWMKWLCLPLAGLLLLSGCGTPKEDSKPIRVAITDDIVSLDVAGTKDILSETVGRCVFSTLYTFDENLTLTPCLAQQAEQVSDREWVFTLRDDAKFHDGSAITAADVVFCVGRAMTGELADQSLLVIEQMEAVDDITLRIVTTEPVANEGDYLRLNDAVTLYQVDSTKTELLILNPRVEPIDDPLVRQAIACAIDKQNLVDNVLSGYGRVQSSMIPAPLLGFADFEGYTYDPERAKGLLAEAGYPNGFDFTVLTFDSQRKKLMEQGTQMGAVMSWTSNADPDSALTQLYSKAGHPTVNQSGFTDPRVEELLQQGRMATDAKIRDGIYKEINAIVAENYVAIPLYQPAVLVAARKEIGGVKINPQGIFDYESLYRLGE